MGNGSHHRRRSATKTAVQIVLVLAVVTFGGAVVHFSYTAYESGQCYTANADSLSYSGEPLPRRPIDSRDCRQILASSEEHQRIDACIAILAIVLAGGAAVRLSKASHHTKRIVLVAEVAVVTVGVAYTILLATVLR